MQKYDINSKIKIVLFLTNLKKNITIREEKIINFGDIAIQMYTIINLIFTKQKQKIIISRSS